MILATESAQPAYPRPDLVRPEWLNLNGRWEFRFDDADVGLGERWHERPLLGGDPSGIVVPFPFQASLSGVGERSVHEVVWYARGVELPPAWQGPGRDVLLHFGAVDYRCTVWVNGQEVGHNRGGHVPFSFAVSPYLRDGENRLVLRVEDRQDPHQPRGKQASGAVPEGVDYWCTTGIWQTVWLEPVPAMRIERLGLAPSARDGALDVTVSLHAPSIGWTVEVEALRDHDATAPGRGEIVAAARCVLAGAVARLRLIVPAPRLWSPETPHLYGLRVRLRDGNGVADEVASYFGLRDVALEDGRFVLNGEPTYLAMVLDQGYWPDGLLAAPSDGALRRDVELAKAMGFNGVRKHQKIEDPRWLYWCDRLGLLVWGEMPNARAWSPEAEELLLAEWERAVVRDRNHPCVVTWVPLNESMGVPDLVADHPGQFAFVERLVAATRELDPTRPVVDNDGWDHTDVSDLMAVHDYTPTPERLRERYAETLAGGPLPCTMWNTKNRLFVLGARYRGQPVVLSEVGGFLEIPPDVPPTQRDRMYQLYAAYESEDELTHLYEGLMEGIASLPFVAGFCYTQLADVEQEKNGLLTHDRRPKVPPERLAALHARLFSTGATPRST